MTTLRGCRPQTGSQTGHWPIRGVVSTVIGMALALVYLMPTGCGDDPARPSANCITLPDTLCFDAVLVGASGQESITLINSGSAVIKTKLELDGADFSLVGVDSTTILTITPDDSVTIDVRLAPMSAGTKRGTLTFTGGNCPGTALVGQGVPPDCSVEPGALDFGTVLVGERRDRTVMLINDSAAVLETHTQILESDFKLQGVQDEMRIRVEPEDSLTFTVSFIPTGGKERTGTLSFAEGLCPDVPLTGWGDLVACDVIPGVLDFGAVSTFDQPVASFQVVNIGTLRLEGAVDTCEGDFIVESGAGPFSLGPDESWAVTVRFAPPRSGTYTCELSLGVTECAVVMLQGQATQTWRIREDGTGDAPTIQRGIELAANGDTVLVGPGHYYETVNFLGQDIVLKSTEGPKVTIIDGTGQENSVVMFESTESRACVLEGFTITGGVGTTRYGGIRGGGIMCAYASPTIRGNIIKDNAATRNLTGGAGGGLAVGTGLVDGPRPAPLIQDNVFNSNIARGIGGGAVVSHPGGTTIIHNNVFRDNVVLVGDGGGVFLQQDSSGEIQIVGNQFWENVANDHGGAILVVSSGSVAGPTTISHNLMVRNIARGLEFIDNGSGGAIYSLRQRGSITHNTIVRNVGGGESPCSGGGITLRQSQGSLLVSNNIIAGNDGCGITCIEASSPSLGLNILWENPGGDLGNEDRACPVGWGEEVIIEDPLFCDPENDNFMVAENSPAITVGTIMGAFLEAGCGPKSSGQSGADGRLPSRFAP